MSDRQKDKVKRAAIFMMLVSFAGLLILILAATLDIRSRPDVQKAMDPRCNSGARYDAMREAYERREPDPCNPNAKTWVP